MSDIRARIADALREHQFYPCTDETPGGCIGATCTWHGDWWPQWWNHLADVLLSLPGIAIVELPEPYPDETVHPYWSIDDVNGPQVIGVTDSDDTSESDWVSIEFTARWRTVDVSTARALAAALLAAAEATA